MCPYACSLLPEVDLHTRTLAVHCCSTQHAAAAGADAQLRQWTHWGLSPGPSACGADVMPLHHVPLSIAFVLGTCSQQNAAWQRDVLAARVQHATGPNIPHPCCIPVNMVLRVHLYQQPTYMPPMAAIGDRPMSGLHYVAPGNRLQLGCGEARFIAHGVCWAGTFPFFPARRQWNFWAHWDLSPGPSACGADVMPLHHVPHGH